MDGDPPPSLLTFLYGQSNWLAGEVRMALSLGERLNELCNHHPRDPRSFLDPHCEQEKMKCHRQYTEQQDNEYDGEHFPTN